MDSRKKPPADVVLGEALKAALEAALDRGITDAEPLSGGDIHRAFRVTLGTGKPLFVKTSAEAPADMFPAEAKGLAWLREAAALRIPEVLAVGDEGDPPFLALELLDARARSPKWDELLGHRLAALHRAGAESFGFPHPNYIGRLPQANTPHETWAEFYVVERLEPQLRLAVDAKHASLTMKSGFQKLFTRMERRVGDPEPPARLHGDLWSGNVLADEAGEPALIDPAVYGGSREMDLAMMRLFGGFADGVFRAYDEVFPVGEGWEERVPLYQLYPLLVHVNLFGYGYVAQVEHALRHIV